MRPSVHIMVCMTTAIDFSNVSAVLERARYLSTMFGRNRNAWHIDGYSLRTLAEQVERGEVSDYYRKLLTEELPAPVVERCIALPTPPSKEFGCGGRGYYAHYDTDYDCGGCAGCRTRDALIGWSISAFTWSVATGAERTELERGVRGMFALAQIGRAVAAAGAPGLGVSQWIGSAIRNWNEVQPGRWYRVTGKRGHAKEHHGAEGEVMRIEHGPGRYGSRGALRAALRLPGESKWAWVPTSALTPVPRPVEAVADKTAEERSKAEEEAARAARPAFVGEKGDAVYVIAGPNAGRNGVFFWAGVNRGQERVGVRTTVLRGGEDAAWCDARDVIAEGSLVSFTTLVLCPEISDAEIELLKSSDPENRLPLADRLEERGYLGLAKAWRGPVPQAAPKRQSSSGGSGRSRRRAA